MILEFGEYLPDKPPLSNPGCLTANNCFPVESSYRPLSDLAVYTGALTERPLGSASAKDTSLNAHVFAGSASKLYKLSTTTWADVSIAGGYAAESWEFAQYGDDIIAVSLEEPLQYYTLGVSSLFANLIATLQALTVASSEEFVMVGNTFDTTDGSVPHRVRWCAIGDHTDWTVSATTQADYEDLNSVFGEVKKVVFAGDFYAFQEKAITRLRYVGSPTVFQVDTFETKRGAKYNGSVVSFGDRIFYLSEDGFYMLRYSESHPIGADKVDKTFFADLNTEYATRIRATIDPINNLVMWAYPSNNGGGALDKQIIYNWKNNRWSTSDYTLTHIGTSLSLGYTLEQLDSISTDIDAFTISLDSRTWKGGELSLMGFNSDWKMCYFNGNTKSAVIESAEFQPIEGQKAHLLRLRGLMDANSTLEIGKRDSLTDTVTWSSSYSPETNGDFPTREKGRYFRTRWTTSGDFDHLQGFEALKFKQAGSR
jgi:hypothetical protein